MKDVFISYKAEEMEEADWVKSVLESNGISCWMAPSCIPGGSRYATEIPQAIRQSKVFVLILSSKAQSSQWVSREIDLAINEGKIVLPFMLENCGLKDDFNFYLTNVQRYAAYENKLAAAEKMIKEIKALLGSETAVAEEIEMPKETVEVKKETVVSQNFEKPKFEIKSIISFALGIISFVALLGMFILPNIAALVLSILSLKTIRKKKIFGKGFAITGQVLGLVSMIIGPTYALGTVGFVFALIVDTISLVFFISQCVLLKKGK